MTQATVIQGTSEEIAAQLERYSGRRNLMLIVPQENSTDNPQMLVRQSRNMKFQNT